MAINVTPFVGTDNFNMETFNNMISQINSGVNSEISDVLAQLGTKAKIQTGSYVGTGTYGADNPCSLTFDFEPKLFIISQKFRSSGTTNSSIWMIAYYGINYGLVGNGYSAHVNISGNAITYYDSDNAKNQYNDAQYNYDYIVIG